MRAASSGVDSRLQDTLTNVLQAHAELYEAEIAAQEQSHTVAGLKAILARADQRFQSGHGTTVAIGQARSAALDAEQSLNRACQTITDKAAALAQAVGLPLSMQQRLWVDQPLPLPLPALSSDSGFEAILDNVPAVLAAKQQIEAAQAKLQEAKRAFGPTVSLSVRRDYLGQDPESLGAANHHIAPNDYRVGLSFEQPLFPLLAESAQVGRAKAQLRRSQANYEKVRLDVQTKLQQALSAQREAEASYIVAKSSLAESVRVLELTQSQFHAGRTDLDSVEHAQMDRDKAEASVTTSVSRRAFAEWLAARALEPGRFPNRVFAQLHLPVEVQTGQDGSSQQDNF